MSGDLVVLSPKGPLYPFREATPSGVDVTWVDSTLPVEQQAAQLKDALVIIGVPSMDLARQCPRLRLVQTPSAGTDGVDVVALGEMGIRVANGGGGNAVAVSEHAVALMLSVYRKLPIQFQTARAGEWGTGFRDVWISHTHELTGKTVGIVGLGRIGQEVARRLRGFNCKLLYYDAVTRSTGLEEELGVTRVSMDELLRSVDIVTLHVPLTDGTRGMIGARELGLMKPTGVLINSCRGPVVDEAALVQALRAGDLAGAGLDVLEEEPPPADNPLLRMDNVSVTPHMASFAQEAVHKSWAFAIQNAARVVAGQEPESVVLPELGGPELGRGG